jgi:hypothetical protein
MSCYFTRIIHKKQPPRHQKQLIVLI